MEYASVIKLICENVELCYFSPVWANRTFFDRKRTTMSTPHSWSTSHTGSERAKAEWWQHCILVSWARREQHPWPRPWSRPRCFTVDHFQTSSIALGYYVISDGSLTILSRSNHMEIIFHLLVFTVFFTASKLFDHDYSLSLHYSNLTSR